MELEQRFLELIATEAGANPPQVSRTIALLTEGATVPFIARYRKDTTGNLDDKQIFQIQDRHRYYVELVERRSTVLTTIRDQGNLTDELQARIMECNEKSSLEDLYLPFKPKRRTKATIARERGLEPLARAVLAQTPDGGMPEEVAQGYVDPEKGIDDVASALEGARHIVAEIVAEDSMIRADLRRRILTKGKVRAKKLIEGPTKYDMYDGFSEPVATIPSHRMLAIRRGANEDVLAFQIALDEEDEAIQSIMKRYQVKPASPWGAHLANAIGDSFIRLLKPSIETEIRADLKSHSDEEAIRVFEENLQNLLLSPPAGSICVLGIDPGFRTGCKVAVVDGTGKFLEAATIYPTAPRKDTKRASKTLHALLSKHAVRAVAVGNGTASRETDYFVHDSLKDTSFGAFSVMVNETGASVYSASDIAREEHPDLDVTIRGALSIARRLQDPLAELVKIDPKSLGVGQYQHDVDQKKLKESLGRTVESCVNKVGVELNTSSWSLLRYTSGLTDRIARNVIQHREGHGPFRSRSDLLDVKGLGEKTFQQCAGFLRIRGADHPLDNSGVHPESYGIVEQMATMVGITVKELVGNDKLVEKIDLQHFTAKVPEVGEHTLQDIKAELLKPGRDPRAEFAAPRFREDVNEIADLEKGMKLQGKVTNVTRFGAFVDIGVHQDGLVHVSELDNRFVEDPGNVVKVGDLIDVEVLDVDLKRHRISLSRKKCIPVSTKPPTGRRRKRKSHHSSTRRKDDLDQKIKDLAAHFGGTKT